MTLLISESLRNHHSSLVKRTRLQALLAAGLNGQRQHAQEGCKEQGSRGVNGRGRVCGASVDSNNGRAETSDSVEETGDTSTGATVGRREDLGGVGVEHTVHDVLEEGLERREGELEVGVGGDGEDVEEDAGDDCCNGHGTLAADVLDVDGDPGEERTRHTDGGGNGVVAVLDVDRGVVATKVLGQESVEERVAHADESPDEPEENGGAREFLAVEERADTLAGELAQIALDDLGSRQRHLCNFLVATDLVQDLLGEPCLLPIVVGNSVDDGDGFSLATAGQEEFGRLEEVEEEEAGSKHAEGKSADDVDEVAPSLVAWEVDNAWPSDERCDKLTNRPPTREKSQKTAVRSGQEFKKKGAVDRQVTSNAETNTCVESTGSDPVGCSSSGNTEDTSDAESAVESETTANNVGHDTPERGTNAETEEESESCVSDLVRVDAEFFGHGRECQGNTLEPEAGKYC